MFGFFCFCTVWSILRSDMIVPPLLPYQNHSTWVTGHFIIICDFNQCFFYHWFYTEPVEILLCVITKGYFSSDKRISLFSQFLDYHLKFDTSGLLVTYTFFPIYSPIKKTAVNCETFLSFVNSWWVLKQ